VARLRIGLVLTVILLCSVPALGGLFEDLYRGLEIYATPSGSPITGVAGGGRSNGARFGRLRIVPNELGQGYRLELDRSFGVDTRGRPETFDLGNFELQLSGATQSTLQFTRRGILTGNADFFANNLGYSLRGKSGGQDFELRGQLSVAQRLEVNRLGFYSLDLEISNANSSLIADGVLVDGERDVDFNVGPITIQGNVFFDAALALLTSFGVDTSELEGIFPESPIDRINDEIEQALRGQALVLGETLAADIEDGTLSSAGALESQHFVGDVIQLIDDAEVYGSGLNGPRVPEPASLLLLGLPALVGLRRRT
jgi:hypothetical protein